MIELNVIDSNTIPLNIEDDSPVQLRSADPPVNGVISVNGKQGTVRVNELTDGVKQALLLFAEKVAYIDENGQDYYDALESALYPTATLVSISAVYTQSGTVYDADSLDSLKQDLVVTANYDDGTTQTVLLYTLSGTLEVGTSTITVSYQGKTTTFTVTVTSYWTWKYKASDGQTLSQRTDLFTTGASQGTLTETVSDGLLHITANNNGGQKYWAFISPTTNSNAVMEMRIKYAQVAYANEYSNLQIQLSNGTGGAKVGASRKNNKTGQPSFSTIIGTTTSQSHEFDTGEWYTVRIVLRNDKQSVYVNDTAVIENANICTSYCIYNRIFMQCPNNSSATTPSEVYVDYIAYRNED